MKIFLAILAAVCGLSAFSLAAEAQSRVSIERRYTSAYNQCLNGAYTTLEMNMCFGAERERQDARLNQAYVMVMRPLAAAKKATLRTLQRAWIKQRDVKCERAGNEFAGGTMSTGAVLGCLIDETIKRTLYLENYR